MARGLYIYDDAIEAIFYLIKNRLIDKNDNETIDILNSSKKWLKNIHMINEIFAKKLEGKDKFDLKINFDFPEWLQKNELPLSKFKKKSTYKLSYNIKQVNNLISLILEQYGNDKQIAFTQYLSLERRRYTDLSKNGFLKICKKIF